jgi:hypothetical protein
MKQLLLFEENEDETTIRKINTLEEKYDTLRKGQHARISGLQKEIRELRQEIEFLKAHICKGNLFL